MSLEFYCSLSKRNPERSGRIQHTPCSQPIPQTHLLPLQSVEEMWVGTYPGPGYWFHPMWCGPLECPRVCERMQKGRLWDSWGVTEGFIKWAFWQNSSFKRIPEAAEWKVSSRGRKAETEAPGQAAASGPGSHDGVCACSVPWLDRGSLEEHEWLALLRFLALWRLHHKSWFIKSLAIYNGFTLHPSVRGRNHLGKQYDVSLREC